MKSIENMIAKNKTWGGKRKGAGRPNLTGKVYCYKADKDLITLLDNTENRNRFINEAVKEKLIKDRLITM